MFPTSFTIAAQLSDLRKRIQRLEIENASLRAEVEGAALRTRAPRMTAAAEGSPIIGFAGEPLACSIHNSPRRGRAGGLARARQVSHLGERWSDGRFMAHTDWEQVERE